ncbi:MAG: nitroreductase family protein [Absicoccus porci]|jgi:ferredoxin|uniref:nitroreductase family protein n=1 Tax=Absicoccus porci TaxID=2486576 RepID=UPI0024091216|nr:nitroreductase family protein [Absicoccus porci]MDD6459207.1 nitroreductase family protein [Absicoccus porci]
MKKETKFFVDEEKCIHCGQCVKVCPGGILSLKEHVVMKEFSAFGWNGCWQCEHCLAVCPTGALSIFGHDPKDSILPPNEQQCASILEALIVNRHTCRRYKNQNVDPAWIHHALDLLANAPNGGNKQQVEYTLIDDKDEMAIFRKQVTETMKQLAKQGIYPEGFDSDSYEDMVRWQETVRPDMVFCGAPHVLIPHAPMQQGTPIQDVLIASAYFELLCEAHGLGASLLTFPLDVMKKMPSVYQQLEIPNDHYVGVIIGFGYPEIPYHRGVQKQMDPHRIHHRTFSK